MDGKPGLNQKKKKKKKKSLLENAPRRGTGEISNGPQWRSEKRGEPSIKTRTGGGSGSCNNDLVNLKGFVQQVKTRGGDQPTEKAH